MTLWNIIYHTAVDNWVNIVEDPVSLAGTGVGDTSVGQTAVSPWVSMTPSGVGSQDRPILLEAMSEVVLNAADSFFGGMQAWRVDIIFDA